MTRRRCEPSWPLAERLRFYAKVCPDTGCWLWTGRLSGSGYATLQWKGMPRRASRLSYETFVGSIPAGAFVLHACHTPRCVNPKHLRTGTHQDNMNDKVAAGRQAKGETHTNAKLQDDEILEIRRLRNVCGWTQLKVSKVFGVDRSYISRISRHKARKQTKEQGAA